jgi:hypothetical protein
MTDDVPRTFPELVILSTTDGAGFPIFGEVAPVGLVIDFANGTWSVPRRSERVILLGQGDMASFGLKGEVVGVYRRTSIGELAQAYADARNIHLRVFNHGSMRKA